MKINYGKEVKITNKYGEKFVGHFVGMVEYVIKEYRESLNDYEYFTDYRLAFQTKAGSIIAVEQTHDKNWSTWSLKPMCFIIHWGTYRYEFPEYLKSTIEFEPVPNTTPSQLIQKFISIETDELPF